MNTKDHLAAKQPNLSLISHLRPKQSFEKSENFTLCVLTDHRGRGAPMHESGHSGVGSKTVSPLIAKKNMSSTQVDSQERQTNPKRATQRQNNTSRHKKKPTGRHSQGRNFRHKVLR